jgi:Fe2+ or Zn2+ uptake regulation protein
MNTKESMLLGWKETLKKNGFRLTEPRLLVMEILANSTKALSPLEIFEQNLESQSSMGIASVYRTLEILEDLDLVQKIHQPGGCHAFWPALNEHQHLVICTDCGCMVEIPCNENIQEYFNQIEDITGYVVADHWMQLFGSCRGCLN